MKTSTIIRYCLLLGFVSLSGEAMAADYAPGACGQIPGSQTCVDAAPCKTDSLGQQVCLAGQPLPVGGVTVNQTCWQYSYQYACAAISTQTCGAFQTNPNCSIISSSCMNITAGTNTCDEWLNTYSCQTQSATTVQTLACGDSLLDKVIMPTPSNPNANFVPAAVAQEMIREGATYTQYDLFFSGIPETCTQGYLGLHNCCQGTGGAQSNAMVALILFDAGAQIVKYAGSAAIDWASVYVYDAMYANGIWTEGMIADMTAGTTLAAGGFNFSAIGFTYSTVPIAGGTGFAGGNTVLYADPVGGNYIVFNPYVFAAVVVIAIVQNLSECTPEEQMFALHKGAGLSQFIREDCYKKNVFGCYAWKDSYCSFNSVLAKVINIQGKTQLGLDISNCQGITASELGSINFATIDFSEFTQSIISNQMVLSCPAGSTLVGPDCIDAAGVSTPATMSNTACPGSLPGTTCTSTITQQTILNTPTPQSLSTGYTPILQNTTQGSGQSSTSPTLLSYPAP